MCQLILVTLSHLQLHVGSATPVFNLPFAPYAKWIDRVWLTSVWQYISQLKLELDIEDQWTPKTYRVHDIMVMDSLLQLNFSPKSVKQINSCGLYLQVLALSDIDSADGRTILSTAIAGERVSDRASHLYWPLQQRPPANAWAQWNLFISHISTQGRLLQSLGDWVALPHQQWEWFEHSRLKLVYQKVKGTDTWLEYHPIALIPQQRSTRQTKYWYQLGTDCLTTPPLHDIVPTTLTYDMQHDPA